MPRKAKRRTKSIEAYTHLAIRVEHYEARVGASVNHNVYAPESAWSREEDDPLYQFTSQLIITGTSTYPEDRDGDVYELTICGEDAPSQRHNATLKDAQARDDKNSFQYRTYRGREIPVYVAPKGLGILDKVRGEPRWSGWLFTPTRFVNDMLVLLGHRRDLFLALHEYRESRQRWIRGIVLQTTDPAEE